MAPLSPGFAIAGGLLIGLAAALFLLLAGRIAGISGLTAIATRIGSGGTPWAQAASFIVGLPLGAWVVAAMLTGMLVERLLPLQLAPQPPSHAKP